jgi:hypothetical protein
VSFFKVKKKWEGKASDTGPVLVAQINSLKAVIEHPVQTCQHQANIINRIICLGAGHIVASTWYAQLISASQV